MEKGIKAARYRMGENHGDGDAGCLADAAFVFIFGVQSCPFLKVWLLRPSPCPNISRTSPTILSGQPMLVFREALSFLRKVGREP